MQNSCFQQWIWASFEILSSCWELRFYFLLLYVFIASHMCNLPFLPSLLIDSLMAGLLWKMQTFKNTLTLITCLVKYQHYFLVKYLAWNYEEFMHNFRQSELLKLKSKVQDSWKNQIIIENTNCTNDCSQLSSDNWQLGDRFSFQYLSVDIGRSTSLHVFIFDL